MPLLHENNNDFELETFDDDDDDDLVIRRTTSYSTRTDHSSIKSKLSARQTSETINVNQAIACALKSRPKSFHYTQKRLQNLPPSIKHLEVCDTIREFDLHGNQLRTLPNEIEYLKFIEFCNLGKMNFSVRIYFTLIL